MPAWADPAYREPNFTDPVIQRAIRDALDDVFGDDLVIEFKSRRQWSIRGRPEDFETARHVVETAMADITYARQAADGRWQPDYYRITREAAPSLETYALDRFRPHREARRAFVEDLTAFAQLMPYRTPAQGFLSPRQTLDAGYGDCDSKAVLVAAMMTAVFPSLDPKFVMFPDEAHVMLAVDIPPLPGEYSVPVGTRQYVLLEVAGPGRFAPGDVPDDMRPALREGRAYVLRP